jgi:hypothetical protein
MQIYIMLFIYNYLRNNQWWIDNLAAISFLTFVFMINRWLKLGKLGFLLFNFALLAHNLGTFGFYAWTWSIFAYDNLVHILSSIVAAYILFNFIARKLHIRKDQMVRDTVIDEHKAVLFFLVIASVAMLGTLVEMIEYVGFMYLGPGEGLFFVGEGDSGFVGDVAGQYIDTMEDIFVNTLGSIIGSIIYYYAQYRNRPWLR